MKKIWERMLLVSAVLLMAATGLAQAEEGKNMTAEQVYQALTKQEIWLNTEKRLTPEDLRGRIILVDFWTFCCINCMHVIPDLHYLEEKFGDKLTVIGVHSAKFANERDTENIRSAILRYDITHPVVNDHDFAVWNTFGVRSWPTFVLINPQGKIAQVYSGEGNRERAEKDIQQLIDQAGEAVKTTKLAMALEKDKAPESPLKFPSKLQEYSLYSGRQNPLLISDSGHHRILLVSSDEGKVIEQIGSGVEGFKDGSFEEAQFNHPQGVLANSSQMGSLIYIADTENHALRVADMKTRTVTTIAGTGKQGYERNAKNAPALATTLASPWDLAFYPDDKHIAIAMAGTHQLWSYDTESKTVSVLAGNGRESIDDGAYPDNSLSQPSGLSVWDGKLYFVDSETSSLRVFEDGKITTLIGTGLFDFGYKEGKQGQALMQHALGVYADETGVLVADSYNHSIRIFNPATGELKNLAGTGVRGNADGALAQAGFNEPNDIARIANRYFIADTNNNQIRILEDGKVSTLQITAAELKAETFVFDAAFPAEAKLPRQEIAADGVSIRMEFEAGRHLNKEAPSSLALYDAATHANVTQWDRDALVKGELSFPKLQAGKEYILQGSLYHCEDKVGSACLIKWLELPVKVAGTGEKAIVIPVK